MDKVMCLEFGVPFSINLLTDEVKQFLNSSVNTDDKLPLL